MSVCGSCARFGVEKAKVPEVTGRSRVVQPIQQRAARARSRDVFEEHPETLAPGFGRVVREARERAGLSLEELGLRLNERKTVLAKVEDESLVPSDELIRKLEKLFGISLLSKPEAASQPGAAAKASGPLTLGDLLADALKKKKQGG